MAQTPDLLGLGPRGKRQREAWGRQGSWVWRSRWNCQSSDSTGIGSLRLGDARGRGYGAVAETARARTLREQQARGLGMPGVVGMEQSLEL